MQAVLLGLVSRKAGGAYRNTKLKDSKCETNVNDLRHSIRLVPRIYKELLKSSKKSMVQDEGKAYRRFTEAQPAF